MIYKVTVTDSATYVFDDAADEDEAIMRARDWFSDWASECERRLDVKVEKVRPCQVEGNCPYEPGSITCSACGKEN